MNMWIGGVSRRINKLGAGHACMRKISGMYVHTANYLIPARGKKSTFPFKYGFWPGNLANQLKVENRILITLTLLVVMIIFVCVRVCAFYGQS